MDDTLPAALAADLDGAFERLVREHQDRMFTIALRLVGDRRDAEEIAQDAFIRAYRAIRGYERARVRELQLRPWLAAIVVNLSRNRLRRHRPAVVPIDGAADVDGRRPRQLHADDARESPHDAALRNEATRDWATLVGALPERYRTPVVLRHVDGLSYEEMSAALGRPQGTLKAQVHRGLAQLRSAAEQAGLRDREEMTA